MCVLLFWSWLISSFSDHWSLPFLFSLPINPVQFMHNMLWNRTPTPELGELASLGIQLDSPYAAPSLEPSSKRTLPSHPASYTDNPINRSFSTSLILHIKQCLRYLSNDIIQAKYILFGFQHTETAKILRQAVSQLHQTLPGNELKILSFVAYFLWKSSIPVRSFLFRYSFQQNSHQNLPEPCSYIKFIPIFKHMVVALRGKEKGVANMIL